jgi:hypothetical protein
MYSVGEEGTAEVISSIHTNRKVRSPFLSLKTKNVDMAGDFRPFTGGSADSEKGSSFASCSCK